MCQSNTSNGILPDESFAVHKTLQKSVYSLYQQFDAVRADRMNQCGYDLLFMHERNISSLEERERFVFAYTCKDRFCSFCNWRRARKLAIQTYDVLDYIQQTASIRFLHLTLTIQNPSVEDVRATITKMNMAFQKMFRWKRIKESILGFVKILEVNPQKNNNGFFHPHFHVLLAVSSSYFNTKCEMYIKQEEWCSLWRRALDVDYLPSIYVRVIKPNMKGIDAIAAAVTEVCKYPFKSADFKNIPVEIFKTFVGQLENLRRVSTGGEIKSVRQKMKMEDSEDGDLVFESEHNEEIWEKIAVIKYRFDYIKQNYYVKEVWND